MTPSIMRMYHVLALQQGFGSSRYLPVLWLSGAVILALATWTSFLLGLNSATVACIFLIVIVLLSLADSFITAVIFPILAVGVLDFLFIPPPFAFEVRNPQDFTTLSAFLITSIVITGLVRRLRRLGQAHREQARLLDLTRDSVLVRNLEHVITYWNLGSEELYGWKKEDAIGRVAHQLLQTIFPAPLEQITDQLCRNGRWEGELRHTRRDGEQVIVSSRWSVQLSAEGQTTGTLETNNDITQRKQAEEALRRTQESYLTEAQQLSQTGSFGWNVSSGDIFWSEEGFRIFGFDSTTRPSMALLLARVHPEDLALVRRVIDRAANNRHDFDIEHRLRLPGGIVKHVRVVARAMQVETGNVDFVGAVMDVTSIRMSELELRNTRTELAHVMRVTSLGELTASIAHEVNQPLGAVVANAEACLGWLDREPPDLNEAHAAIERIVRDGHRAAEVIRGVRALIEKTDAQMAPLDVSEIVSEAMNFLQHELLRYRVSQRMELSSDLPAVFGDRIQLQQVLLNLIINAIEAMQPITDRPRELVIRSEQIGTQQVQVTVRDGGIGLSGESAHRIFDAFVTTKSSGMGMGLSICRSIIQAHGGQIWASSNEPFGVAVKFTLPLHRQEAP